MQAERRTYIHSNIYLNAQQSQLPQVRNEASPRLRILILELVLVPLVMLQGPRGQVGKCEHCERQRRSGKPARQSEPSPLYNLAQKICTADPLEEPACGDVVFFSSGLFLRFIRVTSLETLVNQPRKKTATPSRKRGA